MGPVWKLQPGCCGLYVRSAHIPVASLSTCSTGAHLIIPAGDGAKGCVPRGRMASPGCPCQQAPWKQRGGVTDQEWQSGSLALGTATATLAWMKSGAAVAVDGRQRKGSMAGAFLCLMARLPLALYPATSFMHAPGIGAGMACWIFAGHLCPSMPMSVRLGRDPLWDPDGCSPILCQQQRICLQENRWTGLNCPLPADIKGRERGCLFPGMKQATSAQSPAPAHLWDNDPLPGDRATSRHHKVPNSDH